MHRLFKYAGLIFITLMLYRCAQPGSLGGGPKDETPPQVLKSEPENRSANFKSKKITITFDEFITLNNINQKALISPPMDKMPDFKLKGKSLQIKFNEPLKDSTTYSIYFADAIVDLKEGNPILNYTYIFSTGSKVDSLSILGKVTNAFDLKPVGSVFVLLYKDNNDTLPLDSLPYKVIPYYVSKTTDNGVFQFDGLGNNDYLMFALNDMNANYIYDQPGEEIAFIDTLIRPYFVQPLDLDSLRADTTRFPVPDTLEEDEAKNVRDSLIHNYVHEYESKFKHYDLLMFKETDSTQRLLNAAVPRKNNIQFSFSRPATDISLVPLNFNADTSWYADEISKNSDTITWYLKDLPVDTLEMLVMLKQDTLDHLFLKLDPSRSSLSRRQQKKAEQEKDYLDLKTNIKGSNLALNKFPEIEFYQPVKEVISDSILLVNDGDSTYSPEFTFLDSLHRKLRFPIKVEEEKRYVISIPDSSFIDWNGNHNQKIQMRFSTKSLRDYGVFVIHLKPKQDQPYVFQLLNEKEEILQQHFFSSDTTLTINYLDPATYILKIIFDNNGNKKWDSGNYGYKIQPEKVIYYSQKIQVRANWEVDEEWEIE
jgi:hypothetical protein